VARSQVQRLDQRGGVLIERVHVVTVFGHFGLTLAAEVEADAAVAVFQRRDLPVEHATTPEQAMCEDDGLRA
jgi:hypothetical protein